MAILPETPRGFGHDFPPVFTRPTFRRFLTLLAAAIVTVGLLPNDSPIVLVGDDTVFAHPGRRVCGKARHRDPLRSSHAYTPWRYAHKGVVLAVLVRFPFAVRPSALPVLVALDRRADDGRRRRHRHRTPAQHAIRLLRLMLRWFPGRRFVFVGDSAYGTHEMARFGHRHRQRLVLVSKLHPEANRFEPAPAYRGQGRPRIKGERLPQPKQAVAATTARHVGV